MAIILKSALVNGVGALVTGITTVVVLVAKFAEGAWITLLFVPLTIVFFAVVRRHYHAVKLLTSCSVPVDAAGLDQSQPQIDSPGVQTSNVPNFSATTSGAWFSSITPPPTRIVLVAAATCPIRTGVAEQASPEIA
jgi:hypothetical protein